MKKITHGSLFSGIGGFDLAAQWIGWENRFHCEWNKFGQKVLKYYWPEAISYEDITTTDFRTHRGEITVLSGGFPCQPYSHAGKRLGKEDDRHLWPEMLRAIQEIQPVYIVGENVSGLISWNEGVVFDEVQADLENEGYSVQSFVLPACAVNAPHRRDRVWIVAYTDSGVLEDVGIQPGKSKKLHRETSGQNDYSTKFLGIHKDRYVPGLCEFDGVPKKLDGITVSKWRRESIAAYGNSIVPQVAYQIFSTINTHLNKE